MPELPFRESGARLQLVRQPLRDPRDETRVLEAGLRLGAAAIDVAATLQKSKQTRAVRNAENEARRRFFDLEIKLDQEGPDSFDGSMEIFDKESSAIKSEIISQHGVDDISGEIIRQTLDSLTASTVRPRVGRAAVIREADAGRAETMVSLDEKLSDVASRWASIEDRDMLTAEAIIIIEDGEESGWYTSTQAETLKSKFRTQSEEAAILRMILDDPENAEANIQNEAMFPKTPPIRRQQLRAKARAARNSLQAGLKSEINRQHDDEVFSIMENGSPAPISIGPDGQPELTVRSSAIDRARATGLHSADELKRMEVEDKIALEFHEAREKILQSPPAGMGPLVAAMKPPAGSLNFQFRDTLYNELAQTMQARITALDKDSAAAVSNMIPSGLSLEETFTARLEAQRTVGVIDPKLWTVREGEETLERYLAEDSGLGKRAIILDVMNAAGRHAHDAMAELVARHQLPYSALLVADPRIDANTAAQLGRLDNVTLQDLRNLHPQGAAKDIEESAIQKFNDGAGRTFPIAQIAQLTAYTETVRKYALHLGQFNPNTAGADANRRLFDAHYEYVNETLRVPKGQDTAAIQTAGVQILDTIETRNPDLGFIPGVTIEQDIKFGLEVYKTQIRDRGRWYTNPTETGAWLYWGDTGDRVTDANGDQISFLWSEAVGLAAERLAEIQRLAEEAGIDISDRRF